MPEEKDDDEDNNWDCVVQSKTKCIDFKEAVDEEIAKDDDLVERICMPEGSINTMEANRSLMLIELKTDENCD